MEFQHNFTIVKQYKHDMRYRMFKYHISNLIRAINVITVLVGYVVELLLLVF